MINLTELLDKVKTRSLELPLEFDGTKSSEGKLRFMKKHKVKITPDANGNGDDVFKASNIGHPEDHGYNRPKGEDAKVYEEVSIGDPSKGISIHIHKVGHKVTFLEPDPKSGKEHHIIKNGHIVSIENDGTASKKLSNSYEPEGNQIDEYNLNKSMGLFAYINYYVESQSSVISDFSIKDRIKLAFTDFFSEIKDKQ